MKKKTSKLTLTSLGFTLLMSGLVGCSPKEMLKLKEETVTKELGETVSIDPKEYLVDDTTQEILEKTVLDSELLKDEGYVVNEEEKSITSKDKEYLNVGEYTFTLTYNESENKEVKVIVQDTTAPEFVKFSEEVSFQEGDSIELEKVFDAKDYSEVKITVEGEVDTNKPGDYKVVFVATDESGNKTEKECTIKITENTKESQTTASTGKGSHTSTGNSTSNSNTNSNNSGSSSGGNTNNGGSASNGGNTSNSGGNNTQPPVNNTRPAQYLHDQEQVAFTEINKERVSAGMEPYVMADDLNELADIRAKELVNEHATGTVHSGFKKYNTDYLKSEVAAVGHGDGYVVVAGWMNSPRHKEVLLYDGDHPYVRIGISCYDNGENIYWIAVVDR